MFFYWQHFQILDRHVPRNQILYFLPAKFCLSDNYTGMNIQGKPLGVRGISWCEKEAANLIAIWSNERIQDALALSHKNIKIFEKVSQQMRSLGHSHSALECWMKAKGLRAEYCQVVNHNQKAGNSPTTCPFYKELDCILCNDRSTRAKHLSKTTKMKTGSVENEHPGFVTQPSQQLMPSLTQVPVSVPARQPDPITPS